MKKILIPIGALLFYSSAHAQLSPTENYVYTKTYLDYNGTTPSKTAETVQYFDGLGRPKQVVNVKASPQQKDVVTHIEYDGFGRQMKDYLPVPQSNTMNGAIISSPLSNATQPGIYGSEKIYSEKILENSPLDRVQQQIQVGNDWSQKPVKFDYDANIAGEVIKYTTTTTWENGATKSTINYSGSYGTAQLYKNTVTDEDGNKTIEFKNGQGQTVLVRKVLNASENADTYYVYNEYDQLAWVVPPLLSKMQTWGIESQNALAYEYRYDGRNRLVEKKLPGKGWEYMVYDKADRLIATQDANQKLLNKWLFTKYDKFGRVLYTGISIDNGDRNAVQTWVTNTYGINVETAGTYTQSGLQIYYANTAYPQNIESILSVNYYDTYPAGTPSFTPTLPGNAAITDNFTQNINTKSLPVASYVKNIEDDNWTKNYTWYDNKGRVIATHSINHLGGYTKTESQLDFSGVAKHVVTRHKRLDTDVERMITENFTYDHQNRLLIHTHQVDGNDVEYLAQNEYNELSQLKSKKVGGASAGNGLQTVDYAYNIRGWMKSINNPNNLGSDLFAYKLGYETAESPLSVARFNGNISETDWITANDGILRRYSYTYDSLNRLKTAGYQKPNSGVIDTKAYDENVTYDLNGNILTLRRFGGNDGNLALKIDDIDYTYDGNQLIDVWDSSGNFLGLDGGDAMSYDANGNIVNDWAHFISNISYNHLNLPSRIDKDVEYYEYIYSADGRKLMSFNNFFEIDQIIITDYLDGFQYNDGVLQFIPTTEGYYSFTENRYVYNYTDHLGNIRVSYTRNGSNAQILEENNYYPFGLKHTGYNSSANNSSYNYKYNGKELMTMGYYDYGARFYMPDLGRWAIVDPLSDATFQPYNYVNNNPISFIDPTGMIGEDFASIGVIKNKKGEYEIVSAKNDGDYGIYLADSKGNYNINRSQRVGTLNNSFDFLFTNDTTGKFTDVAKRDNGSNITLTSNMNLGTLLYKYGYRTNNGIEDYELDLGQLAILSANGATLDLKVSLGLDKYSPVRVGKSYTSLRAASNLLFGFNMRKIYDKYKNDKDFKNEFNNAESFYIYAMQVVGSYNQFQNNRENFMKGNGYNKGFPFYGEHAYSGYNIYRGYFHQFTNQKLHRDK